MNAPQTKFRKINIQQSKQKFAKGGFVKEVENTDDKYSSATFTNMERDQQLRDFQGQLTGGFQQAYPDVPIGDILTELSQRKIPFGRPDVPDMGKQLVDQYGDKSLTTQQITDILGPKNSKTYFNLTKNRQPSRTVGSTEQGAQRFGWRNMIIPQYQSKQMGVGPYKFLEPKKKPEEFSLGGIAASAGMGALSGSAIGFPWGTILGGAAGLVSGISGHVSEKRQERARDQQLASQQSIVSQQVQLGAEQATELAAMQRDEYTRGMGQGSNAFAPTFAAHGATIPASNANAELEKGEVYRTPDKMIYKIGNNAKTHTQGGELMQLPEGTEILGKDTVANGETAKELGNRLANMQNKHLKILENRPTSIERETSKRMLGKVDEQYSNIMAKQQSKKRLQSRDLNQPITAARGGVIPKFQEGGTFGENWQNFWGDRQNKRQMKKDAREVDQLNQPNNSSWGGGSGLAYGIGMGLSTLGGLYNIFQGTQPAKQLDPELYRNQASIRNPYAAQALSTLGKRKVNINPYLTANRQAEATGRYNVRRQGVGQGQYLGNLAALSGQRMRGDERAYQFKTNREADFLRDTAQMQYGVGRDQTMLGFQRGQFNAQQDFRTDQVNLQSEAAQRAYMGQGFADIGGAGQMFARNMMSANRDKMRMDLLPDMFDTYNYNNKTGFSFKQPGG